MKQQKCSVCDKAPLQKDEIAATKRLLGDKTPPLCFDCLAEEIGFERDELDGIIERLKEEGCKYFL